MFRQLDECWFEFNQLGSAGIQFTMIFQLTGAGGLAHSAGNSWRSAQSGERCVLVRISVDESGTVTGRADGPGAGRFDQIGLRLGTGSGQASRV